MSTVKFIHRSCYDDYVILVDGEQVFNDNSVDEIAVRRVAEALGATYSEEWNVPDPEDPECPENRF